MHVIEITILLLLAVVVSSSIDRILAGRFPLPFIQILLGILVSEAFGLRIELEPQIFLLLFIAPLLFLDGWLVPKQGLMRDRGVICALALGLVLFTVIGAGYFVHWLIPGMPLAIAFALAAILSPTDAVALSAISARTPIPKRLMHILEGEALLNDASGLVCMRFAVAAALTGYFSLLEASLAFVWIAAGGLLIGAIVTLGANAAKDWIANRFGEETGTQILISILIPFIAYLVADYAGVSAILAAVAAGIAMNFEEMRGLALPITRIRRSGVWTTIQFALNGVIFVLLGDQFPIIMEGAGSAARNVGLDSAGWLWAYAFLICAILLLFRLSWGLLTLSFLYRRKTRGSVPVMRLAAVTAFAGARGALTLSGVMALPLLMPDGSPFPAREVCVAFAACTIVLSLISASVALPLLLRGLKMPNASKRENQEDRARAAAAAAAIRAVEKHVDWLVSREEDQVVHVEVASRIVSHYRRRIGKGDENEDTVLAGKIDQSERQFQIVALGAEREELYRRARSGSLAEETARALVREIDLLESRFGRN